MSASWSNKAQNSFVSSLFLQCWPLVDKLLCHLVKAQNNPGFNLNGSEEPDEEWNDPVVCDEFEDEDDLYVDFVPPSPEEETLSSTSSFKSIRYGGGCKLTFP